ncbi:MAG: trypsin-like peptidase domain-containing protein [Patescibacteria group bacterium]
MDKFLNALKNKSLWLSILLIAGFIALGFYSGAFSYSFIQSKIESVLKDFNLTLPEKTNNPETQQTPQTYTSNITYEQAIIDAVKSASPSVVSIIISKNLPVYEQQWVDPFGGTGPFGFLIPQQVQNGTQYKEVGAGSGFIVSSDGLVLTNKHVVLDKAADYTVLTNDGQKYSAKVLALDPVQDLAVIKIQNPSAGSGQAFPTIKLGDSTGIQIGQGAIAIGNALGQFSNTVSVGIVSGLQRTISASDQGGGFSETLEGIIQTDAAINSGNSGGPLLNLRGEVIGVNTAMAQGAESIGFAIPINIAKRDIEQVVKTNKIVYPFLGVRYVLVDSAVKEKYKLSVDYGALVLKGSNGEPAITAGSAADKAGIKANDVILEIKSSTGSDQAWEKITKNSKMSDLIQKYNPGDKITLKILRNEKQIDINTTLGER